MNWWQRWRLGRAMKAYFKANSVHDRARAFLPESQRGGNRALGDLLNDVEVKRRGVLRLLGMKP